MLVFAQIGVLVPRKSIRESGQNAKNVGRSQMQYPEFRSGNQEPFIAWE